MKAVICRVGRASVQVCGDVVGAIGQGLLVYVGVVQGDDDASATAMAQKLVSMRLFNDAVGKINLSVVDVDGGVLLVPNFTLAGCTSKGTRPSFAAAADPEIAADLFAQVVQQVSQHVTAAQGRFGADMTIDSVAEGPVTLAFETP
jgi:D-tyrosyl-tRNA(Tyr) deacylase